LPRDSPLRFQGEVTVRRGSLLVIRWASTSQATVIRSDEAVGNRRVVVVAIPGADALRYDIRFHR
jgi:hypothetical protein